MKLFTCQRCNQLLFFESVTCTSCGARLAYLPESGVVSVLDATPSGNQNEQPPGETSSRSGGTFRPLAPEAGGTLQRLCRNDTEHAVCNWAVPASDPHDYCRACRLNHVIPPQGEDNKKAWQKLEIAKRRLVYALLELGLPVETKEENPAGGLAFDFLADDPSGAGPKVFTGHDGGLITINIAEADAPFREQMRKHLGETYRTLLGHFRHEIGHYYWARLVKDGPRLEEFRGRFGDERADYAEAQQRHYQGGPPDDWNARFVSAYASMHPWEDWAETWAHYLHMADTIETAQAHGLSLRPAGVPRSTARKAAVEASRVDPRDFDDLIEAWFPLTIALNNLNRSMGTRDVYPFVLSQPAIDKLRFVHRIVTEARAATRVAA